MEKHFLLFSNCVITKGVQRAIIADLQNDRYTFVPNSFADIINALKDCPINVFCTQNNISEPELIDQLDKLESSGLGHYTDEVDLFPEINTDFKAPYLIQDCIIELSELAVQHSEKIIRELAVLGCQSLELRCYDEFDPFKIQQILDNIILSRIRNVEIYVKYDPKISKAYFYKFLSNYHIVTCLTVHSCPLKVIPEAGGNRLRFIENSLSSNKCCGKISKDLFKINLHFYLESLKHNTCLNRKISIDLDGNIKNCPSHSSAYGKIPDTSLTAVVASAEFKKLWDITKESIKICQQCEFRNICSDCRVFLEDENDIYSKPLKCGYNPLTGEWDEWSKNPLKQKAIDHYGLREVLNK